MAGKTKHFLQRNGRYFARIVIPKNLRPYLDNRTELRTPLGGDLRAAQRAHPIAVAELMHKIALAERKMGEAEGLPTTPGRYPLTDQQLALRSYHARLNQDDSARNQSSRYAAVQIDDAYAAALRQGIAGSLGDAALQELVGHRIAHFKAIGNTTAKIGSADWRSLARAICISEYEALSRLVERDEGDFSGKPANPILQEVEPVAEELPPVPIHILFNDYIRTRELLGRGKGTKKRWSPVIESLRNHLGHDNARKITKSDIIEWRNGLLETLSPKTVHGVYLASIRTVFAWAVREDRLESNPSADVRQPVAKKRTTREKGFTRSEGTSILQFSFEYAPKPFMDGPPRELAKTSAAKRWVPLLCAHTGARVVEITQLRKEDVRKEGDGHVIRITPDAGTVKSGLYRDVPLHRQIIELGFLTFVNDAPDGPLFVSVTKFENSLTKAQALSGRISKWLHEGNLVPEGVSPNHGWRHRFKTVANEEGLAGRITEAICGHASRTAGDDYGDVTVVAKRRVIDAMPNYEIEKAI